MQQTAYHSPQHFAAMVLCMMLDKMLVRVLGLLGLLGLLG